ncbi:hypothetical protein R3W88_006057 [Solanum pinnatisectum]|uniref:Uncharacterized protein n=1 Tax=Solanum pinnatisectum TaxID=50273 RepID=A0AAV9KG64_9SOLN|nr:hypothetical protein R3W88_006057 [Solanum pinnatisectum]
MFELTKRHFHFFSLQILFLTYTFDIYMIFVVWDDYYQKEQANLKGRVVMDHCKMEQNRAAENKKLIRFFVTSLPMGKSRVGIKI